MKSTKVSVCLPVHNGELWVAEAIDSIIEQSLRDWEIICFDDGSTDATPIILEHYASQLGDNFKIIDSPENRGIAFARNACNILASGEIICVQDADDISHKDRLKKVWKYFKRHKNVDILYGSFQYIDQFGKPQKEEPALDFDAEKLKKHNFIAHPTVAYRKSIGIQYREECKVLDDWFLYLDCIRQNKKFGVIKEVLSFYRILPTSVSNSEEKAEEVKEMREKFLEEAKMPKSDQYEK